MPRDARIGVPLGRESAPGPIKKGDLLREKRQHARAPFANLIQIVPTKGPAWEVECIDISQGGMFLQQDGRAFIGDEIQLRFELTSLGKVTLPAYIRWTASRGFGVQFGLLGARETHAIGSLVLKSS